LTHFEDVGGYMAGSRAALVRTLVALAGHENAPTITCQGEGARGRLALARTPYSGIFEGGIAEFLRVV
jgi:hypothetical protein